MSAEQRLLDIRERAPDQCAVALDIANAVMPADARHTLEEVQVQKRLEEADSTPLRLLAWCEGTAVAAASVSRRAYHPAGRFRIWIAVLPEYRCRGIARSLYRRLLTHAREQGAREVTCDIHEYHLALVERWLGREGFREIERMRQSELALPYLDLQAHEAAEQRAVSSGLVLTTLGEEDTEHNRRKLWELDNLTRRDIPADAPHQMPFDRFQEMLDQAQCLRDCLVIARDGDRYVGFSILAHRTPELASTWMTGVHPDYRNRGLALAIKARSAGLALDRGYRAMRTWNHINNPSMLAVNRRLGYAPLPEVIHFLRSLTD